MSRPLTLAFAGDVMLGRLVAESLADGNATRPWGDLIATLQGGLPTGHVITAAAVAAGASVSCTLTYTSGATVKTANFTAIGIV